ncbi:MAG: lipoyl protein ligase domain-containing protein [Acidimicrobiales bacterium]
MWQVEERRGSADALHEMWPDQSRRDSRTVAFSEVTHEALVVGSMQVLAGGMPGRPPPAAAMLDERLPDPSCPDASPLVLRNRNGRPVEIARRRSGGGAVFVAPQQQLWVDLWIPRDDPLFCEDVLAASVSAGRVWVHALQEVGIGRIEMHGGRVMLGEWGSLACFASIGPGEVLIDGRKVVGISQRRTRHGAWFQTMLPLYWDPAHWVPYLACVGMREDESGALERWLADHVTGLGTVTRDVLAEAFLSHLPR